jgi:hypothetical protein
LAPGFLFFFTILVIIFDLGSLASTIFFSAALSASFSALAIASCLAFSAFSISFATTDLVA